MVASAALLIRERGAHPTAIADVLKHSGAPRGSAYHYFPGGRNQLLCEAVDSAADYVADRMAKASSGIDMLDAMVRFYRRNLVETDYRAGCPVMAVAVEAGDPQIGAEPVARAAAAESTRSVGLGDPPERLRVPRRGHPGVRLSARLPRPARSVRPRRARHRRRLGSGPA